MKSKKLSSDKYRISALERQNQALEENLDNQKIKIKVLQDKVIDLIEELRKIAMGFVLPDENKDYSHAAKLQSRASKKLVEALKESLPLKSDVELEDELLFGYINRK